MMATCSNCIHFELCFDDNITQFNNGGAEQCTYFKDRSKFVDLPCKVGDTVYRVGEFVEGVKEFKIHHFRIFNDRVSAFSDPWDGEVCKIHQIGKIIKELYDWNGYFLTKEEAEKALEERT